MEIIDNDEVSEKKRIYKKCEHGKRKYNCGKCEGNTICINCKKKRKYKKYGDGNYCVACYIKLFPDSEVGKRKKYFGTKNCKHKIGRYHCKKCHGKGICEHGKRKYRCKEGCISSQICKHKKEKERCGKCGGKALCNNCKYTRKNKKYDDGNYCVNCYIKLNPDSEVAKKNRVVKQDIIDDIYIKMYPDFSWETKDKSLPNDCGIKRRPDYFIDYGTHCLILEIDENQHKGYNKQCEISRLNEISTMVNDKPIIYIRFNPDSYKDIDRNKVEGCFTISPKIGKLKPLKRKIKERLKIVHQEVLKYSDYNNVNDIIKDNLIHQIYLFFNK